MSQKYDVLADDILSSLGGKDNISFFTHCATRLRLSLKDMTVVDEEAIKAITGVVGCHWVGTQLQIIIGLHVTEVYDTICDRAGLKKEAPIDERPDDTAEKSSFRLYRIIEVVGYALEPSLPFMVGAGMVKVVLLLLTYVGLSQDAATYQLLYGAADAVYRLLPIIVGYGVAKKIGSEPAIGVVVGMFLVAPGLMSEGGVTLDIWGISVHLKDYGSTFLPAIFCTVPTCYLYAFLEKRVPAVIKVLVAPLATFLVMIPLSYIVLAPLAAAIADLIATGVMWIYDLTGFIGVAIFCGVLPFLVMTGMHICFSAYWVSQVVSAGGEPFYLISHCIFNIDIGIICAVIAAKTKSTEKRAVALSAGVDAAIKSVSEPALFGILMQDKRTLAALVIGNVAGGAVAGLLKVSGHMWPAGWGMMMLPSFIDTATGEGLINALIAIGVGVIVTAIATSVLYRDEKA